MSIICQCYPFASILSNSISILSGCNKGDGVPNSGNGVAKGTCPNGDEVCNPDGHCTGTCYYHNKS